MKRAIARGRGSFALPAAFVGRYRAYVYAWYALMLANLLVVAMVVMTEHNEVLHTVAYVMEFVLLVLGMCFPLAIIGPNIVHTWSSDQARRNCVIDLVGLASSLLVISLLSLGTVAAGALHLI